MNEVRWGMIGCGNVTEIKSGPGFQKAHNSSLVAVMRRNGELAREYAIRHDVPKWYDDAAKLINDPEVDAVYIATPPDKHMEYTIMCAEAGKPVYVEKPMARNYEECQKMIEACKKANVPLFVAYYRRALVRYQKVKELVDEKLGDIRYVNVQFNRMANAVKNAEGQTWRAIPAISGGDFVELTSHTIDLLDFLLGPIESVKGAGSNLGGEYDFEDMITAQFQFKNGVHGIGAWCFSAFGDEDYIEIIGSHGKIKFTTSFNNPAPVKFISNAGVKLYDIVNPIYVEQPMIQTIVDELTGNGRCVSTGESAARTSWVMDQILKKD